MKTNDQQACLVSEFRRLRNCDPNMRGKRISSGCIMLATQNPSDRILKNKQLSDMRKW